ncbi:MAG: SUMF1/EgtB/PvdO family nonheme iron enzyme [Pseudomonadota bacterium]
MPRALPLLLAATLALAGPAPGVDMVRVEPASGAPFGIDRAEVDLAAFERFAASGYQQPELWSAEGRAWLASHPGGAGPAVRASGRGVEHPVVAVTWYEAEAFCRWRGGRLPSGAEWRRAACGEGGGPYPWGAGEPEGIAWFDEGKYGMVERVATAPATVQAEALRSRDGLLHAAGNVWEWTTEAWPGAPDGPWKVLRGGSYANLPSYCSCGHEEPARPDEPRLTAGFRCAYDI